MSTLTRLRHSTGVKQSIILTGGNIVATGISAISIILLSRFLGPEDFGIFSIAFSLSMLTTKIFDFGLNMSLQKYLSQAGDNAKLVNQLITYVGTIKGYASILIIITAIILNPVLSPILRIEPSSLVVFWGILLGLVIFWYDFIGYIFQGLSDFLHTALLSLYQSVTKVVLVVGLIAVQWLSPLYTYIGYGLAPLVGIFISVGNLRLKVNKDATIPKVHQTKLWAMTRYTSILTISAAINDSLDTLLVQNLTSRYETGLFSAANRISLLFSVIAFSINSVLNTRVAKYTDHATLIRYSKKAILFSGLILLGIGLVMPVSKLLLFITAGSNYYPADGTLKLLLGSSLVLIATAPFASVFYAVDKPVYFALSGLLQVTVLLLGNLYLVPIMGISGAGLTRLLMRCVVFGFTLAFTYWALIRAKPKKT